MKSIFIMLSLFNLFESNELNDKSKQICDFDFVCENTIINKKLCLVLDNYINDSTIVKYSKSINFYQIDFFENNKQVFMSISAQSILIELMPQNELDRYVLKGFFYRYGIPILIYDKEKSLVSDLYFKDNLFTEGLPNMNNDKRTVPPPQWIYLLKNNEFILFKINTYGQ